MTTSICTIGTSHSVRDVGPVQSEATQKKMLLKSGTGGLKMAKYLDSGAFQAALVRKQCGPANQRYTDGWNDCLLRVKSMVSKAPAADVAPVVHAQWIEDGSGIIICPECKRGYNLHAKYTHYCPNCGAKMDGGQCE